MKREKGANQAKSKTTTFKHQRTDLDGPREVPVKKGSRRIDEILEKGAVVSRMEKTGRGRRPLADWVYVKGTVNGVSLTFITDSEASRTIIPRAKYNEIPIEARQELAEATRF